LNRNIFLMAKKELQTLVMEQKILNRIHVVQAEKIILKKTRQKCMEWKQKYLIKEYKEI
jgi:hypothetical protein